MANEGFRKVQNSSERFRKVRKGSERFRRVRHALVVCVLLGIPAMLMGQAVSDPMKGVAERYVKLVLAVGQHDADYVDAFYGPAEWRKAAEAEKLPLSAIDQQAEALEKDIAAVTAAVAGAGRRARCGRCASNTWRDRCRHCGRACRCCRASASPSTRSRAALYDAVAPTQTEAGFDLVLKQLEARLPGDGSLIERYDRFKQDFVIPTARVDRVFREAIRACRRPHAGTRRAAARGAVHRRVRHRQVVEWLQLVPGRLQEPDPGEHRPADLR